jgi:hypothetical protein
MKLQVLKVGTHTDSKGVVHDFTEEMLKNIASKYNPATHEAPMVLGHPKDNDPAVGWIKSANYNEDTASLELETNKEHPDFMEAFNFGSFKKWSVSLYPDMTLRHLGFLGAIPPAIKGLSLIGFSQSAPEAGFTFDFMDYDEAFRFQDTGKLFRNLREYIIEKEGLDKANALLPDWIVNDLENTKPTPKPIEEPNKVQSYNEHNNPQSKEGQTMTKEEQAEFDQLKADNERLKLDNASFAEEKTQLQGQIATITQEAKVKEFGDFCEGLVQTGKMKATDKEKNVNLLVSLDKANVAVDFSENAKTAVDAMKETLANASVAVDFNEHATKDKAGEVKDVAGDKFKGVNLDESRVILFNEATAIQARDGISFQEALVKATTKAQ